MIKSRRKIIIISLGILVIAGLTARHFFLKNNYRTQYHVRVQDLVMGTGTDIQDGQQATVEYVTRVMNGPVISESKKSGQPFVFVVGAGQVMPGWEEGIRGLRVGGKRKILIPPEYAYGARGSGTIVPPNATLEVELELIKLTRISNK